MNKKGAEGAWWTFIVLLILIIVAIFVIYSFMVKNRGLGDIFTSLKNQLTTTEGISLKGVSEEVKNDPEHYLDSVLNEDPQRYIEICGEKGEDPKRKLSLDDIKLLKERDCRELTKARENSEDKADKLYEDYKNGKNDALTELKTKYASTLAYRVADVLESGGDFDKKAGVFCANAEAIITKVYCGDLYEVKASRIEATDSENSEKYKNNALFYYNKALDTSPSRLVTDRDKKFFANAHFLYARIKEKLLGGYLGEYKLQLNILQRDGYEKYLSPEYKQQFENKIQEQEKKETLTLISKLKLGENQGETYSGSAFSIKKKIGETSRSAINVGSKSASDISSKIKVNAQGYAIYLVDKTSQFCYYELSEDLVNGFNSEEKVSLLNIMSSERPDYCGHLNVNAVLYTVSPTNPLGNTLILDVVYT